MSKFGSILQYKKVRTLAAIMLLIASMVFTLLPVVLNSSQVLASVPPEAAWGKTFGALGRDEGHCVQRTSDGGFIIVGSTESYGAGSSDVWLIKTDSDGNKLWDKTFGGSGDDFGQSVQQASDGGYIIVGSTESYGAGSSDVWLIKTNSSGNQQWNQSFGGPGDDFGQSVQQTSDGGYIILGTTWSFSAGSTDVWLIKTDAIGVEEWNQIFGDSFSVHGKSVQQTYDGGYIILAEMLGGYTHIYLIKTDSGGNKLWDTASAPYIVEEHGECVQQTSDGGYIIVGSTWVRYVCYDILLIKTNSNGNILWRQQFDGGSSCGDEFGQSVQQTFDGGYIIAGSTASKGAGLSDVWLIKTDSSGNEEWNKTFGGSGDDFGESVQQITDRDYIIAGFTESYGAGSSDVWLIKTGDDIVPEYTINFDSKGGTAVSPITQDYGTLVTSPAEPIREGYTFIGWSPSVPATMPARNLTCVAQWTGDDYTINFDSKGGSAVSPITQDYGTWITPPANPNREGYNFTGWSPSVPDIMPAKNITCVAKWKANQYTINFDSNGGSAVSSITRNYGTWVTLPANPTRAGYNFAGWNPSVPVSMPSENITCVARWTSNPVYNLTIAASGSGTTNPYISVYPYIEGKVVNITATPNSGWEFVSWSGNVADPNSASTTVRMDSNKTVTANFTEIESHTLDQSTILPDNSAVLENGNDRIVIEFPSGSVEDSEVVTSQEEYRVDLPSIPSGFKAGATYFSIDPIEDLAPGTMFTITAKYSAADLEACDGDPYKLKLARYDEDTEEWVIMPTIVDTDAMTLTASTDQFSTWMVMVEEDQNSSFWIWIVFIFTGLAVLLAIGGVFIVKRQRSAFWDYS